MVSVGCRRHRNDVMRNDDTNVVCPITFVWVYVALVAKLWQAAKANVMAFFMMHF